MIYGRVETSVGHGFVISSHCMSSAGLPLSLSLSDAVYAVKQSKASLSQICFWSKQRSRVPTRDRVGEAGESSWLCLAPSSGSVFLVRERVGGAGESPLPVRLCLAPSSGSLVGIGAH